jgi:parallel beta helix pectate lyase-like protein
LLEISKNIEVKEMKLIRHIGISCVCTLIFISSSFAATYYVKNGGNDGASGLSDNQAWATIAKVNDFAENKGFSDGDIISFKRGDRFGGERLGNDGSPISWGTINGLTIRDYGSGNKPIFDSEEIAEIIKISAPGITNLTIQNIELFGCGQDSKTIVYILDVNGVSIDGIDGDGRGSGSPKRPDGIIKIQDCYGDIVIKNCNLHDWGPEQNPTKGVDDTLVFYIWTGRDEKSPRSIKIHDNIVYNINSDAVQIGNFQGLPQNTCDIYNNIFYNCGENAIDMKASTYVNIYQNTFYRDNFGLGGTGGPGPLLIIHTSRSFPGVECDEVSIYENKFLGNNDGTHTLGGIFFTTANQDIHIYANVFENVSPAIWTAFGNHLVENNVFIANQPLNIDSSLKTFVRQESKAILANNTFFASGNSNITTGIWQRDSRDSEYWNNIIFINSSSSASFPLYVTKGSGNLPKIFYNDLYNPLYQNIVYWDGSKYTQDDLGSWQNIDEGALSCDPLLKDVLEGDFSLKKDSCCILPDKVLGATFISAPEELRIKESNQ